MVRSFRIFFMFMLAPILIAEDNSFYSQLEPSLIYLEHVVYMDRRYSSNPELFARIEEKWNVKVLNNYITLQSGSGFIIDLRGYGITNRHVVQNDANIMTNYIYWFLDEYCREWREEERHRVGEDLLDMLLEGTREFRGHIQNEMYQVEILLVAQDEDPDLALIKLIGSNNFVPLKLASEDEISNQLVGQEVYSLGFPLGSTMDMMFDQRAVTMNSGTISAYRDANLGLQHSAAISPGNSGGPLVNENQIVLGVNTAEITEGNSLFLSEDSSQIHRLLKGGGYSYLLNANSRIVSRNTTPDLPLNVLGEIESSSDLLINAEPGSDIYINGEFTGKAPMYYIIEDDLIELRVENSRGVFEAKVRRLTSLVGTTELVPQFETQDSTSVRFTTTNSDSPRLFADGIELGTLPLDINLALGSYQFVLQSDEYFYPVLQMEVSKNTSEIVMEGTRAYPVEIEGVEVSDRNDEQMQLIMGYIHSVTPYVTYHFTSTDGQREVVYNMNDRMLVPPGDWILSIVGIDFYDTVEIPLEILPELNSFHTDDFKIMGTLVLTGLSERSQLFLNGTLHTIPLDNSIEVPVGDTHMFLYTPGKNSLDRYLFIEPGEPLELRVDQGISYGRRGTIWSGLASSFIAGGVLLGLNSNDLAVSQSKTYSDYLDSKGLYDNLSVGMVITGAIALIPTFINWGRQSSERQQYRNLQQLNQEQ